MNSYTALGEFKEIAGSTSLRTGLPAAPPEGELSFRDVSFRYSPDSPDILRGLDLDLVVGGSTAIVGLNGAGKTTLVKLLARLYEPTGGRIVVDGRDLAQVDARDWQRQVAVVF
ncbi:ATP-binding cassette domain-containing protein, partial [Streptomyces sp. SID7499]|nr:ATP-binding cassette domain-containing protein [Streptomyces sp. SID7499]